MAKWMMGADPEFFCGKGDGTVVPSWQADIPHKSEPLKGVMNQTTVVSQVYRDGWALELSCTPSTCRESLVDFLRVGMDVARRKGKRLLTLPTIPVNLALLEGAPGDVQEFGCEPAFSAYDEGQAIVVGVSAREHPFRYAGGHMHFSLGSPGFPLSPQAGAIFSKLLTFDKKELREKGVFATIEEKDGGREAARAHLCREVQMMDLVVGLASVIVYGDAAEVQRRQVYGRAGEFRLQQYGSLAASWGLEYRTPSTRVFNSTPSISLFFLLGNAVHERFNGGALVRENNALLEEGQDARAIIQEGDRKGAEKLWGTVVDRVALHTTTELQDLHHLREWWQSRGDVADLELGCWGWDFFRSQIWPAFSKPALKKAA